MHPLCLTMIRRPDLVADHLGAYAALFKQEADEASKMVVRRVLVWLTAVVSVAICVVLSGTALMLGVLQNQFHWILIAVPVSIAVCALGAFAWTRQGAKTNHFTNIKSQLLSDASALRAAAGQEVK